ncbi:hypothetical protein NRA39_00605 [Acinetobacter baumannii]|nr:hypothetical protein [Acinetobacter baumannii]
MTFNEWMGTLGFDALVHANCCRKAYEAGQLLQQAKVEELQKRVDKALELMQKPLIVGEPAKYVCARFKEIEQALKGEG